MNTINRTELMDSATLLFFNSNDNTIDFGTEAEHDPEENSREGVSLATLEQYLEHPLHEDIAYNHETPQPGDILALEEGFYQLDENLKPHHVANW